MTHVALRIVNNVSYVTRISHDSHIGRQAQYSMMLEDAICCPRIVNNVSYVTRSSNDSHFAWQAQYSVMLEDDTGCAAHCK